MSSKSTPVYANSYLFPQMSSKSTRVYANSYLFPHEKNLTFSKISRVAKLQRCKIKFLTLKVSMLQGLQCCKVAKSKFQPLKISRLQGLQSCIIAKIKSKFQPLKISLLQGLQSCKVQALTAKDIKIATVAKLHNQNSNF